MKEGSGMAAVPRWTARLAAALLLVVGITNSGLAVLSLATDLIHLSPDVAGGLLVLGLVTAVVGVFVWRGSRVALSLALAVFAALLLAETAGSGAEGAAIPRRVMLALLVATLAVAWADTRR